MSVRGESLSSLIVGGTHVQDHEFFYPLYRLREEGGLIDVATRNAETVLSSKGTPIIPTLAISETTASNYDLLIIPGGAHAMEYMRQDQDLINLIRDFSANSKTIGSICQGAQLLISAGLVQGKTVSGYYSLIDDIRNAGGTYLDEPAVVDGNLVTTAHYKDMGAWMRAVIDQARS